VLWDNYQGEFGHDFHASSSERNTIVPDSWSVDDAIFGNDVKVERIRWIGWRSHGSPTELADLIALRPAGAERLETLIEYRDLPWTYRQLGLSEPYDLYEGYADLPGGGLTLPPGHYYFGTRLAVKQARRNFLGTTGQGKLKGLTEGFFRSEFIGYPEWTRTGKIKGFWATDFAFQVEGEIIPEPTAAALVLLLAGLARRR
jgi:hypothetical protein